MIFKFPRFEDPRIALRKAKDNKVVLPFDAGETAKKPVPVTRGGALASTTQSYDELKAQLLQQGRLFEDPEFPPVDSFFDSLVTHICMYQIDTSTAHQVALVRVRNPWGDEAEWKGAWSDKSPEWNQIPAETRKLVGLTFEDDGEFWMSYKDFISNFEKLEICHLGPQSLGGAGELPGRKWEMCIEHGSWIPRVSAGGCRNFLETFWINPQFSVNLVDPDEDDDVNEGTMIVGLMQKHRRKLRKQGEDLLTIGYAIYALPESHSGTLDMNFFKYNASKARSPAFINLREVCGRHKLPPGRYAIIPSTFQPNEEAEFMLRIFTEHPQTSE
ncbi:calpain large subunit, domain III [Opisthorchis viverrini]|uniref:Calpain large subunit, domain III n=1 Tax=Opisthorchis viverrini TaxID=6198 RepID=A0A1S8WGZ2_OPIVI|nr:calpain large subunit, domain III [Opisthorchis viverrini]